VGKEKWTDTGEEAPNALANGKEKFCKSRLIGIFFDYSVSGLGLGCFGVSKLNFRNVHLSL